MSDPVSPMTTFRDPSFSLTCALQTVGRMHGRDLDREDVHAALGLSFMHVAAIDEQDVGFWPTYARDAFLLEAACLFGMNLRPVHPPEAARGLIHADEFGQHFDASYRPIIARALEHKQVVLAWQGWPDPFESHWGVITDKCTSGVGFSGTVDPEAGMVQRPVHTTLVRPPVQLYVIETVEMEDPSPVELIGATIDRIAKAFRSRVGASFGVVTGPAAYDAWRSRAQQDAVSSCNEGAVYAPHHRLACSIVAGHDSGLRFLDSHECDVTGADRAVIDSLRAAAGRVVAALRGVVEQANGGPFGWNELSDAINAARQGAEDIVHGVKSCDKSVCEKTRARTEPRP